VKKWGIKLIICGNCDQEVDENEIFCCCCGYNLQESLENMQQLRTQYEGVQKKNWINKILKK